MIMKAETEEKLNTDQLLDRALDCLRNKEFEKADEYCDTVLSAEPYNAAAKLYRLMAEQKTGSIPEFAERTLPFGNTDVNGFHGYIAELSEEYKNDAIYAAAVYNADKSDRPHIKAAVGMLETIPDYKDSAALSEKYRGILDDMTKRGEAEEQERERQKEEERREKEKQIKTVKKAISIALPCAALVIAVSLLFCKVIIPQIKYDSAKAAYAEGKYGEAIDGFKNLDGYKDSAELLAECTEAYKAAKYGEAEALLEANEPYGAAKAFYEAIGYKDAKQRFDEIARCKYTKEYYRDGSLLSQQDVTFDGNGNVIKSVRTDHNGYVSAGEFTYNDKREIIKETHEYYSIKYDERYNSSIEEYRRDNDQNIISLLYTDFDGETYLLEYFYNKNGDVIKETVKDDTGKITNGHNYEYAYDENGNITSETQTTLDGKFEARNETAYDKNGRIIKTESTYDTSFEGDIRLQHITEEYFYDNNGKMIKVVTTSESDPEHDCVIEYSYDDKGNQIKKLYSHSDGATFCYESEYDDNGRLIKYTETSSDGTVKVTEYEYNDSGNVVLETETSSDGSVSVTENFYDDKENLIKFTEKKDGVLKRGFSYGDFVIVLLDQVQCLN